MCWDVFLSVCAICLDVNVVLSSYGFSLISGFLPFLLARIYTAPFTVSANDLDDRLSFSILMVLGYSKN